MGCASLGSDVLPPLKSGVSTLESGYPSLESCYPTTDGPSTTESELPYKNPSCSTSEVVCSYFCNRVVSPLRVLLPLYPFYSTAEGTPVTESETFYHRIRTATQEPELFHIRNPLCPTSESDLFHLRNRAIPPLNPARNLKSQSEFTASRQI